MIVLTMPLFDRMWSLGLWIRKTLECYKWDLMGHIKIRKKSSAEGGLSCGNPAQEVSEGKNISKCPKDLYYGILAKNVASFCPFQKSLPEAKYFWF